ncbi:hypothetical protein FRC03_001878 [Tulasnella sp. 419]|nr:hypothetical protein FRC03_001878 [Tulasnella sp. 419]
MATSQKQPKSASTREEENFLPSIDEHPIFWSIYDDVAGAFDGELLDGWNKSLDILLIFAGLFSAINTAFIIESYKGLQPDPAETTNNLLRFLITHRHDHVMLTNEELNPQSSNSSSILINSTFFVSLSLSLTAAFGIVTAKQWLNEYSKIGPIKALHLTGRERQAKFKGLQTWKLRFIIELLPLLLQLSLLLFFVGILLFLWSMNWKVAVIQLVLSVVGVVVYVLTTLIGVMVPTSPFQTPLSKSLPRYVARLYRLFEPTPPQRHDEVREEPSITETPVGRLDNWGNGDVAAAESVVWMLEQAEHPDATIVALDASLRLPSDLLASLVPQREGLHSRLIVFHNSLFPSSSRRVGDWRMFSGWQEKAVVSGVALFHILKAVPQTALRAGRRAIPWHRKKTAWHIEQGSWEDPAYATRAMLSYSLELVLGEQPTFNIHGLIADLKSMQSSLTHSLQLKIPLSIKTQGSTSNILHTSVDPFQLALEAIILAGFHDLERDGYLNDTFEVGIWSSILDILGLALRSKPSIIIISYTALVVATAQMWNWQKSRNAIQSHPSEASPMELKELLSHNLFGPDKSKSALDNVVLALLLVDVAEFGPISDIHCQLLAASEALFPEAIQQRAPVAYSYLPESLLRLSRKRCSDTMDLQHLILRVLSKCNDWTSSHLSEHREDLVRLLNAPLTATAVKGDPTQVAFDTLLSELSDQLDDDVFRDIFTSAEGLFPGGSNVSSLTKPPERFLRKLLSLNPIESSDWSNLYATQLALCLKAFSEHIRTQDAIIRLPASFLMIQYQFLTRVIDTDPDFQWPAYFVSSQLTDTRDLDVHPDFTRIENEQMRGDLVNIYVWVGECILLLWRKSSKDLHEGKLPADWNDLAFFEVMVVDVILDYYKHILKARYLGFDGHTIRNYLRRALDVAHHSRGIQKLPISQGSLHQEPGQGPSSMKTRGSESMKNPEGHSGENVGGGFSTRGPTNGTAQEGDFGVQKNRIQEALRSLGNTDEGNQPSQ